MVGISRTRSSWNELSFGASVVNGSTANVTPTATTMLSALTFAKLVADCATALVSVRARDANEQTTASAGPRTPATRERFIGDSRADIAARGLAARRVPPS